MQCTQRLTPDEAFNRLNAALKRDGARLTEPRRLLLEAALKTKKPFSAESIMKLAVQIVSQTTNQSSTTSQRKTKVSVPDLATIYRNLTYFNEIGLLARVDVGGESAIYEIASKDQAHHHHYFVCRRCGKTEALEACSMTPIESVLKKKGYHTLSHRLEFTGLCPEC
jgi:Fur family zinc uptake transcriptional regulator